MEAFSTSARRPLSVLGVDWGILAYWIAFGPHGPRSLPPPGEGRRVFGYTMGFVGISFVLFWIVHAQARPPPGTMNKEYQEATNEYLRVSTSIFNPPRRATFELEYPQSQKI